MRRSYQGKYTDQKVRHLTTVEAAWLGAMVEAEGSIRLRGQMPDGTWVSIGASTRDRLEAVERVSPMGVDVYSSEVETVATVLRLVGAGTIYYRPPRNRPDVFSKKDSWHWTLKHKALITRLLGQIKPYLTSKRDLAALALPISGGSCHPTHFEGPPSPGISEEEVERNWDDFKKADQVDPRAIRRQHRFKPGHEPDYSEPESGWEYMNIEFEGEQPDPDQRDLLHGGPESGMPCERCGTMTIIAGEMSMWEVYQQKNVRLSNEDSIDEGRKRELQELKVVVLACPNCKKKYQWDANLLPTRVQRGSQS